jgi:ATPase complex subunit ATP10
MINIQENLLKSFVVSLLLPSIREQVPKELHPTYLVSAQNMEYVREDIGMVNKHVGYVYLVDEMCRIRWAGCGDAKVEEARALETCTGVLLDRLEKKVHGGAADRSGHGSDVPPDPSSS